MYVSVFRCLICFSLWKSPKGEKKCRVKTNEAVKLFQFLFPGCIIIKHFQFQKLYIPVGLSETHFRHSNSFKVRVIDWTKGRSFLVSANSVPCICLPVQSEYALDSREFTKVNITTFCYKIYLPYIRNFHSRIFYYAI